MAGYYGYSMSNNAHECYEDGVMPLSKWSKGYLLGELESYSQLDKYDLSKVNLGVLKSNFLAYDSWHHTSNHYNVTDFYRIDEDYIEGFNDDCYRQLLKETLSSGDSNQKSKKGKSKFEYVEFECDEWGGTKKHPKLYENNYGYGIRKGNRIYIIEYHNKVFKDYEYKTVGTKYLRILKTTNRKPKSFDTEKTNKLKIKLGEKL